MRREHTGTAETHTSRAAASFTFPAAKQPGKRRRLQVGLSRHHTSLIIILLHHKWEPWKKSCFTLRGKPACLCGCDNPARWMLAGLRSLGRSWDKADKGNKCSGCKWQRSQGGFPSPPEVCLVANTNLTFKPNWDFLLPGGIPTAAWV